MVTRIGRGRRKTRHLMKKSARQKGKISISSYFREFKTGDRITLKAEPAVQKGIYFRRFHGKKALIKAKRGACYEVTLKDGNKQKTLIVHPIHMKKA